MCFIIVSLYLGQYILGLGGGILCVLSTLAEVSRKKKHLT